MSELHRIRVIVEQRAELERDLADTIVAARLSGHTWGQIGLAMGLGTRSGARQWFVRYEAKQSGRG